MPATVICGARHPSPFADKRSIGKVLFNAMLPSYGLRVSAPLQFLKIFVAQLRQAGIQFAITSGMACVHYGLQQIATQQVRQIAAATEEEIAQVLPPAYELLP